jgi:hypothetical protein
MASRYLLVWPLAATLSLASGSLFAGPEECLTRGGNVEVAACANQYGPGTPSSRPRSAPVKEVPRALPVPTRAEPELQTVAVSRGGKAPPTLEPEGPKFAVDRGILNDTVIAGAVGGTLLVLVAVALWRWGSTLKRACPWCASKISRSARSCPRCFRAI